MLKLRPRLRRLLFLAATPVVALAVAGPAAHADGGITICNVSNFDVSLWFDPGYFSQWVAPGQCPTVYVSGPVSVDVWGIDPFASNWNYEGNVQADPNGINYIQVDGTDSSNGSVWSTQE